CGAELEVVEWPLDVLRANPRVTEDESLLLIDQSNPIPEGARFDIGAYRDTGVEMNTCVMEPYASLAAEVETRFGHKLYIRSAYRTAEEQEEQVEADERVAAAVGESEDQAGLALDVYVAGYAGEGFLKSEAGRYVNKNCWRDGFIIRYPYYGVRETGIGYEPWHLRYVGKPHAEIIEGNTLTLEGYFDWYTPGEWYQYGEYYVSHQGGGDTLTVPARFEALTLSPDNQGGWWLTVRAEESD
ncbi:MAG: D-alanyl-D-alanine carboxypeptidase family protein, partial [Oscillospiraceae bacterium]|nr:D-alanyl-D-alanine carboxypeptidase family protein [Oscillospiraceae bacterium]